MLEERLSEKQRFWLEHVRNCAASGLLMRAYAEQHGLDAKRFYVWKSQLRQLGALEEMDASGADGRVPDPVPGRPAFVRAERGATASSRQRSGARIIFANGIVIEVPGTVDAAVLTSMIKAAQDGAHA